VRGEERKHLLPAVERLVGPVALVVPIEERVPGAVVAVELVALAVLLERRFHQLKDDLLTAIDLAEGDDDTTVYHPELVTRTRNAAIAAVAKVDTKELFRRGPLVRRVLMAVVLAASLPIAALMAGNVFGFWIQRLALSPELWPRRVHLEVVGFPEDESGRRVHKLARDDKFELADEAVVA